MIAQQVQLLQLKSISAIGALNEAQAYKFKDRDDSTAIVYPGLLLRSHGHLPSAKCSRV